MKTTPLREMVKLPYALDELSPALGRETMEYHYDRHYRIYVENTARLSLGTPWEHAPLTQIVHEAPPGALLNNAGQAYNHALYFLQLTPRPAPLSPTLKLTDALRRTFGSYNNFEQHFLDMATSLFGSGWTWLYADAAGKLGLENYPGGDTPWRQGYIPLMGADCWEHAYYLDYRNRRVEHLKALLTRINWRHVNDRYEY